MILQQLLEQGPPSRDPLDHHWVARNMDTREPLPKQFLSEESMATHFSQLSLHNDLPPLLSPCDFSPGPATTQEHLPRAASLLLTWEHHP
ncbi:hypothetical protein U0070_013640 [Myodes glareolus]|uniref:Uncharacterized protein n=1 Tax=Myodes glareolus TaxID=447135 RepID=A0AAW0JP44_MYOGA